MITIHGIKCWPSRGVAELLNVGRNTMMSTLRKKGVLDHQNCPTSTYSGQGYFVVSRGDHNTLTTYYTPKGMKLIEEICADVPRKKSMPYKQPSLPDGLIELLN